MKAAQCGFNGASVNTLIVLTALLKLKTYVQIKTVLILVNPSQIFPPTFHFEALGGKPNYSFYNPVTIGEILLCYVFNIYKGLDPSMFDGVVVEKPQVNK